MVNHRAPPSIRLAIYSLPLLGTLLLLPPAAAQSRAATDDAMSAGLVVVIGEQAATGHCIGLNVDEKGKRDVRERKPTKDQIIEEAIAILGQRFVLQNSNLDGNPEPDHGPHGVPLVISYNGRVVTGFQMRTSCMRNSGNMGAEGIPRQHQEKQSTEARSRTTPVTVSIIWKSMNPTFWPRKRSRFFAMVRPCSRASRS